MCGLTGFARHPTESPGARELFPLFEALLEGIEHRGTHATGMAAANGANDFLWKWAEPAKRVLASEPWKQVRVALADDTQVVIGHTRYATQPNAKKDECAHPFKFGKVIGAHNGIIRNWKDIEKKLRTQTDPEWQVDSEAIFYGLNLCKRPEAFLEELDGDFALTWMKGRTLYLARNEDRPLHCAYVPGMRLLVWNSESSVIARIFRETGIKYNEYETWQVSPESIYQYRPSQFTEKGTGVEKIKAKYRKPKRQQWTGYGRGAQGGTGTVVRPGQYANTEWDYYSATERPRNYGTTGAAASSTHALNPAERTAAQLTLADLRAAIRTEMDALWKKTKWLHDTITMMYEDATDSGVDFRDEVVQRLDMVFDETLDPGDVEPYKPEEKPKQTVLALPSGKTDGTCFVCKTSDPAKGRLYDAPNGNVVHEKCIFNEVTDAVAVTQ